MNAIRARLEAANGPQYWRSLEAVAETPEFQEFLHREFPANASEWNDPVGRRGFLKLMGASLALAGVTGCTRQPDELIVPYVRMPEDVVPGKPLFFATAMSLGGVATGLLVESHEGRPTKIEGNPDHPATRGGTDVFAQASILTLYDPDRSNTITELGGIRPWSGFVAAIRGALSAQAPSKGGGLRILTETVNSPTLAAQIQQVLAAHPEARWIQWDPTTRDNARAGAAPGVRRATSSRSTTSRRPTVVLSLDADFLAAENAFGVKYARAFASRRRVDTEPDRLSRLYVVEATPSVTGGRADHRLPLKASQIEAFARAVAAAVGVSGVTGTAPEGSADHVAAIAKDLAANRGASLVVAGESQPPAVHAIAHAINDALGNAGQTVSLPADAGNRPERAARRAAPAGRRHGRRPGADAAHRRRGEPGLLGAGRPEIRRGAAEGGVAGPLGAVLRRDRRAVPVARALDALPRDVERRAQRRRHGVDRPAAAAADVRRQVAARESSPR